MKKTLLFSLIISAMVFTACGKTEEPIVEDLPSEVPVEVPEAVEEPTEDPTEVPQPGIPEEFTEEEEELTEEEKQKREDMQSMLDELRKDR